jgi:hypothetical protein
MSSTISGYQTSSVTLAAGGVYVSPVTISGTINSSSYSAVEVQSQWTVSITGTGRLVSDDSFGIFAPAGVTLDNAGYIRARAFDGIFLSTGGMVDNEAGGTIAGGLQGIYSYYKAITTIINAGYIRGTQGVHTGGGLVENLAGAEIYGVGIGVTLTEPVSLSNAGLIESGAGYNGAAGIGVALSAGDSVFNSGTIIGYTGLRAAGGTITNDGLIAGETLDNSIGRIVPGSASTAVLFTGAGDFVEQSQGIVLGSVTGAGGRLEIHGGTLAQIGGFAVDDFAGAAVLGGYLAGFGTITGFGVGDTLHINALTADEGVFAVHELTIFETGAVVGTLDFAGTYAAGAFAVQAEAGGTDITVPCFCAGTRIATPAGAVAVEALRIGDSVRTLHAGMRRIKWIGTRNFGAAFASRNQAVWPVCVRPEALGEGVPAHELHVSPGHGLYVDGVLVPAGALVNGVSVTQAAPAADVHYFHIETDEHEILFAEGCPAETFLPGFWRGQFQNAVDYTGENLNTEPCAMRVEDGFLLQAIKRRIDRRAGIAAAVERPGPVQGYLDYVDGEKIVGWAQNLAAPDVPVCLDVWAAGRRIGRVLANGFRRDLQEAGVGNGAHGFAFALRAAQAGPFEVRPSCGGASLARVAAPARMRA